MFGIERRQVLRLPLCNGNTVEFHYYQKTSKSAVLRFLHFLSSVQKMCSDIKAAALNSIALYYGMAFGNTQIS